MSVIIISSDSYQREVEVAEKTAEILGYKYLGRQILGPAAAKYGMPETKFLKALGESPSLLRMSSKALSLCLAYIEEATLSKLAEDNVVCHGLAAHLYVLGVSHVLKVRILADPEEFTRQIAAREGVPPDRAAKFLKRRESYRKRWSLDAFRQDETNPSLYDLVINLSQIDLEQAVKTIVETVGYWKFRPMTYSEKCMKDMELAARVRATLIRHFPDVRVRADGATVVVEIKGLRRERQKRAEAIKSLAGEIQGVGYLEVHVAEDIFRQAAESFR
ncbi:MAG: cytidylate kinase-like family protein [Pseudomonadota bacterium]